MFNSGTRGPVVVTGAHRRGLLHRAPEQQCTFGFDFQKGFCFLTVHHSSETGITCNLKQIGHKAVSVINLRVGLPSFLPATVGMAVSRHLALLLPT